VRETTTSASARILVIDDNRSIHDDFRKILAPNPGRRSAALTATEAALFGEPATDAPAPEQFELDDAYQGREGFDLLRRALEEGRPYVVAFVDVRMPPGWDGVQTIVRLWEQDSHLQTVICTAHSDYSWKQVVEKLGQTDQLLILKKPFDPVEVRQLACALTTKWRLARQAQSRMAGLEELVARRTRALRASNQQLSRLNADLTIARDLADAASRAKSQFLAHVSHEIRTPLTAVLGFAETLLEHELSEAERQEAIRTICRNGQHLLTLINDLLDLSKIESGQMEVFRQPCRLADLVGEVLSLMGTAAREKGIALQVDAAGPVPEAIQTDSLRLRQILLNLVGNAIKFTDSGFVRLHLALVPCAPAGDGPRADACLQVEVVDSGIGMSRAQIADLFQPFVQVDADATRRHGGTGLGLAISKRLIELLGGHIAVTSRPGHGSTFRIVIPAGPLDHLRLVSPPHWSVPGKTAADAAPTQAEPLRRPGRILLVEDGPDNQRLIAHWLSRLGAEVVVAENGRVALELLDASTLADGKFDLVLMDMQMPELDGYQATALLRQRGCKLPIVALTAHAGAGHRAQCLQAGCDEFLTKPVDRTRLAAVVRNYLEGATPPTADTTPSS
jgi:two-component system sensor histidine kinase/response regulator